MYYSTKNAFRNIDSFAQKMNVIGNEIFNQLDNGITIEKAGVFYPRVDIKENSEQFILSMELPGIDKDAVTVNFNEEGLLVIKGEKKKVELNEQTTVLKSERTYSSFNRSFQLSELADLENVNAKFENGVLDITIGKKEPIKPKEVKITIQ